MNIYEYKGKFYTNEQLKELDINYGDIVTQYDCEEIAKFELTALDNIICFDSYRAKNI